MNKRQFTFDPEKELKKYVLYIRNKVGSVERKGFATFLCYWSQVPYVYEEVLVGWPEQKVFWANDEGASIGMAPMDLIVSNARSKLARKRSALSVHLLNSVKIHRQTSSSTATLGESVPSVTFKFCKQAAYHAEKVKLNFHLWQVGAHSHTVFFGSVIIA